MASEDHKVEDDVRQSDTSGTVLVSATTRPETLLDTNEAGHEITDKLMAAENESAGAGKGSETSHLPEDADGIPYDGGWGWMVALGVFVNYVLLSGYAKSSGLIFVELLERFQASPSRAALLFAIHNGVYSISGFFVMNVLIRRFGAKQLALLGGLFMALSAILSSFANQLTLLICLQSVLLAVGHAMLISPGQVLVGRYFKKWRNLALAFTECGVSFGNILVPPVVSYFLQTYALQGALLLYGGMCLNCLPAAMLHRPLSYYTKRRLKQRKVSWKDTPENVNLAPDDSDSKRDGFRFVVDGTDGETYSQRGCVKSEDQQNVIEQQESESAPLSAAFQCVSQNGAWENGQEAVEVRHQSLLESRNSLQDSESWNRSCCGQLTKCAPFLNFSLFKNTMFYVYIIHTTTAGFVTVPVDYLPDLVSQHGITESQAALLLSIIGGLDLVCRVTCCIISSSNKLRASTVILFSYTILAIVMQFVCYMETFEHFLVLAVIQGLLGSVAYCLFPQLTLELIGLEKMAGAMGWSQLSFGIFMTPIYPLLSHIQDITGSYVIVYRLIGVGLLISGGVFCFVRPVRHCQGRKRNAKNQSETPRQDQTSI